MPYRTRRTGPASPVREEPEKPRVHSLPVLVREEPLKPRVRALPVPVIQADVFIIPRQPTLPPEIVSNILQDIVSDSALDELDSIFAYRTNDKKGLAMKYHQFVAAQDRLRSVLLVNRIWYYAGRYFLYRNPLITSAEKLDVFGATIKAHPELCALPRSVTCLPFSPKHGQPSRKSLPRVAGRIVSRMEHGSYAQVAYLLDKCPLLATLGLRFSDMTCVVPLGKFFQNRPAAATLRTLSLCGNSFDTRYRRRLELGRLMSADLRLPVLEELALRNLFASSRHAVRWPAFPALVRLRVTRVWAQDAAALVLPPHAPALRDLVLGVSGLHSATMMQFVTRYVGSLQALVLIGSNGWRDAAVDLSAFCALRTLTLETTPCAWDAPVVTALPPDLEALVLRRPNARNDPSWLDNLFLPAGRAKQMPVPQVVRLETEGSTLQQNLAGLCQPRGIRFEHLQLPPSFNTTNIFERQQQWVWN